MDALDELGLYPVRIPMRVRFRRVDWREAVLLHGPAGWGEFSPFPEYPPEVTARWLRAAIESATREGPAPVRERIPVNVTVPAVDPRRAAALVSASGATTAKVKVAEPGQTPDDDLARLVAVREALGPEGKIRIDVNGAWGVDEADARLARLSVVGLEYVEQPCATIDELAELKRRVDIPVAADESIRTADDPMRVVEREAADVAILKVQPLGGVGATLDLAARLGLPVVISSALETSVGLAAGVAAAAALPELPYACGLGTASLLDGDVVSRSLIPQSGMLETRRPEPEPELLDRWRPEREIEERMMARLRAAARMMKEPAA